MSLASANKAIYMVLRCKNCNSHGFLWTSQELILVKYAVSWKSLKPAALKYLHSKLFDSSTTTRAQLLILLHALNTCVLAYYYHYGPDFSLYGLCPFMLLTLQNQETWVQWHCGSPVIEWFSHHFTLKLEYDKLSECRIRHVMKERDYHEKRM
jgi:hypothetical protein